MTRAVAFNAFSATILLMMLLFAGLYSIAHNPSLAGFDVQAANNQPSTYNSVHVIEPNAAEPQLMEGSFAGDTSVSTELQCQSWHKSRRGDTQWGLAQQYSKQSNKWSWIKGMRRVSGKSAKDEGLRKGEVVCVVW